MTAPSSLVQPEKDLAAGRSKDESEPLLDAGGGAIPVPIDSRGYSQERAATAFTLSHMSTDIGFVVDALRYDHVDLRMVVHRRTRGMQHRGDADTCAEMLGICGDDRHRLGSLLERQAISADRTG